jgi:WD40 repeat protein
MTKPFPLLPFLLLALLSTQFPAASAQKAGQPRRAPSKSAASKPAQAKPAQAKPAQVRPEPAKRPMRLVVQQGQPHVSNGFAAFSPDGRLVATGHNGGDVVVWDVGSGREVRRLTDNSGDPGAQDIDGWLWGVFSPDSRLLATGVGPNVRLWDLLTGERRWLATHADNPFFEPGDAARSPVVFDADGRHVVVTGTGHKLTWDARTGRLVSRVRLPRPAKEIESFDLRPPRSAASPGGRFVAEAKDGVVAVKEKATGREAGRVQFLVLKPGRTTSYPGQVWHDNLIALAVSPDGGTLATVDQGDKAEGDDEIAHDLIRLWDVKTGAEAHRLTGTYGDHSTFRFTPSGGLVGVSSVYAAYQSREMLSGKGVAWRADGRRVLKEEVSQDGRFVATGAGLVGEVWDAQTGARLARVEGRLDPGEKPDEAEWTFVGFTPLDTVTFFRDSAYGEPQTVTLGTRDWKETKLPVELPLADADHRVVLTPDGRAAAWETIEEEGGRNVQRVNVWRAGQPGRVRSFKVDSDEAYADASHLRLSPDGERVLVATSNNGGDRPQMLIKVYDVDAGSALDTLKRPGFRVDSSAWSPNGELIATGTGGGPGERATLWSVATGEALRKLDGPGDTVEGFSPDGRLLLTTAYDGFARIYEAATGKELCRFITRADGSWVVVDPEGRFDASDLDEIRGVHWLAPDDPLKPLPLEIFMRDYYEPRLLARIISGEKFAPVRALAEVNRAQPQVRIASVRQVEGHPEDALVTVVVEGPADGSGVFDLRLFRDGQLVAYEPQGGGMMTRTGAEGVAFKVRLPRPRAGSEAGARGVEFTAYAFNEDRVKSATARASFEPPEPLAPAKGRAYVVSVGVNAYENEAWDLRFAANDARRLQEVVAARVRDGGEYEEVVGVPLISDYESEGGRKKRPRVLKESAATRRNFKAVLDVLAGLEPDAEALKSVPNASKLRAATPEDLVIISFSSHGYADERGTFYLFTSDVGGAGATSRMSDALGRAVSSDELGAWLRGVDAGELILVVDACHSAASVQGGGFKPGPMGSRGLGQLSYDKGMRILTSTQADDVALESALVEQGLLTYALTRDALESARADFQPKDERITVAEWLAYGVERVPALHAEVLRRVAEMKAAGAAAQPTAGVGDDGGARVVVAPAGEAGGAGDGERGLRLKVSGQHTRTQQPALFDFARRRRDALLAPATGQSRPR